MANRDAPMGLRPAYHLTGGEIRTREYDIVSGYGVDIFYGDLVHLDGTSNRIQAGDAATDAPYVGVFQGVHYTDSLGQPKFSPYWPASTVTKGTLDAKAIVIDDPNVVFEIQVDGALSENDVGQDADIAYTAGSTDTGISKTELKSSDIGTGDNLHILEIVRREDNEVNTNGNVYVLINEHSYANAGAVQYEEV